MAEKKSAAKAGTARTAAGSAAADVAKKAASPDQEKKSAAFAAVPLPESPRFDADSDDEYDGPSPEPLAGLKTGRKLVIKKVEAPPTKFAPKPKAAPVSLDDIDDSPADNRLDPGLPAAPRKYRLVLLPSDPDTVHGFLLRGAGASTPMPGALLSGWATRPV